MLNNLNIMGLIFENLCIRDLRVYAGHLDGTIYHYRDKNGLECDAVLQRRNGSFCLIAIKLGGDHLIEEGVKSLKTLASKNDTRNMQEPSFMLVLCGKAPFTHRREDGVYVVPVSCLKP